MNTTVLTALVVGKVVRCVVWFVALSVCVRVSSINFTVACIEKIAIV